VDVWFGRFGVLITYSIVLMSRIICSGGSPALQRMLFTRLVLKAPVGNLIHWLRIGSRVFSIFLLALPLMTEP